MTAIEIEAMIKALGVPGSIVAGLVWLALRREAKAPEPNRSDVLDEVKALRVDNTSENRAIRDQIAQMKSEMTDRLARVETRQAEQARQLDRIDTRNIRIDREDREGR